MSAAYHEYLELFEYFGRGGLVRFKRAEFIALDEEFEQLLAHRPNWSREQVLRLMELRELLLRDRPRLAELTRALQR